MAQILILFYSRSGHVAQLAEAIARGVEQAGSDAVLRTVPSVTPAHATPSGNDLESDQGYLFASKDDLRQCDGLALGSPSRFGTMAAP
jgi:Multimeric flavodoxin WrbA